MKLIKSFFFAFLPLIYGAVFIFVPIKIFNTDYGWSVLLLFWVPTVLLLLIVHRGLETVQRMSFWITTLILLPVTFAFEFLCLKLDIWNFYQGIDKLWGLSIFGAPIEEFIFWFGAGPFCMTLYIYYQKFVWRR